MKGVRGGWLVKNGTEYSQIGGELLGKGPRWSKRARARRGLTKRW